MRSNTEVIRKKQETISVAPQAELPGLRDNADILFRSRRTVLALCTLFTLLVASWILLRPASYESQMTILVKNSRADVIMTPDGGTTPAMNEEHNEAQIDTEIQVLSSADLFRKVVEQCGLGGDTPASREQAVEKLQNKIKIFQLLKSSMIRVRYASSDPAMSARVLQSLADAYLEKHSRLRGSSGSLALFQQQADEYEKKLREAEDRLIAFQQRWGIVGGPEQKDLLIRKLVEQQSALREAQANSIDTQKRIQALRAQLAQTQKPNSREEAMDVNPVLQHIELELSHAQARGDGLSGRVSELRSQTREDRSELERLQGVLPGEKELLREIKVAEDNFMLYSRKREEARIGEVMGNQRISNVVIAEAPRVPLLAESRLTAGSLAALVLGNFMILLGSLILGYGRRTVYTPRELEAFTGLPVLATAAYRPKLNPAEVLLVRKGNAA